MLKMPKKMKLFKKPYQLGNYLLARLHNTVVTDKRDWLDYQHLRKYSKNFRVFKLPLILILLLSNFGIVSKVFQRSKHPSEKEPWTWLKKLQMRIINMKDLRNYLHKTTFKLTILNKKYNKKLRLKNKNLKLCNNRLKRMNKSKNKKRNNNSKKLKKSKKKPKLKNRINNIKRK